MYNLLSIENIFTNLLTHCILDVQLRVDRHWSSFNWSC